MRLILCSRDRLPEIINYAGALHMSVDQTDILLALQVNSEIYFFFISDGLLPVIYMNILNYSRFLSP